MKICFISTFAYPLFNQKCQGLHGGAELQLYLIAKELAKNKKFNVSFILGDFGQKNVEVIKQIKLYKSFNPRNKENLIKKFIQAIEYFGLFKKINADVYFTSGRNSTVGLVSLFCKLNKKIHIHRTASKMDVNLSSIKRRGFLGKFYQYGLENADRVITQNKEYKNLLKKNHNLNAITIKSFFEVERRRKKETKSFILWVSRFDYMKNPELFLKLAKIFPKEKFVMICPPIQENKEYNFLISKSKKIKNLKFIRSVPFNEIQKYFNEAKMFVNTSDYEGFPNTFIQAGLGKTPILSLNVNPDNFIKEHNCGYFCNNNFNEMIRNLEKLLKNKKSWKQKSENVFKYVKKNHDIKKNIIILKKILQKLQ